MPTQHTETYWTNRYGCRFDTEEAAMADELQRTSRPLKLSTTLTEFSPPITEVVGWSNGLFSNNAPWSEITRVCLLRDLAAYCQQQIALYGDNVGYTHRHCGMGHYIDYLCTVEPNSLHQPSS